MFSYNVLTDRRSFLKKQIERLKLVYNEDNSDFIKNELLDAQEMLKLIETEIVKFKYLNTNK